MKALLFTTLALGSLIASECSAQNGWTRSGNYWVPKQMIAPMPAQARQYYYPNYGRSQFGNAYGVRPAPTTGASNPDYGFSSPQFAIPSENRIGSVVRFGGTTTYRDGFGRQIGSADRFGGTTTYHDQYGQQNGTADTFGGSTTYRNRFGQQSGTADAFGGTTNFRDQYGQSTGTADSFGGTTTFRDRYGRSVGTSDSFGGATTFRNQYGQPGIPADTFGN